MSVKRRYRQLALAAVMMGVPSAARADVVWPALFLEGKLLSVPVIATGLVIEALMLRFGFAMDWKRASIASFVVNAVSTAFGILLIPLAGIAWEIFPGVILYKTLNMGTFNPVTWTATFFLALGVTTSIEVVCLRRFFQVSPGKRTWLLWALANAATVGLAFVNLAIHPVEP